MSAEPKKSSAAAATARMEDVQEPAVPIWLVILFALLGYTGLLYMNDHGGEFDSRVYPPYHNYAEVEKDQPIGGAGDRINKGKKIYGTTCAVCHQATGLGQPGQFPPLAKSDWVNEKSANKIIRIVLNGAQGPIDVSGQQFNNVMVPWRDVLDDQAISDVLTYIRSNKDWGNNAPEVKPEEVKAIREKTKDRSGPWDPTELKGMSDSE